MSAFLFKKMSGSLQQFSGRIRCGTTILGRILGPSAGWVRSFSSLWRVEHFGHACEERGRRTFEVDHRQDNRAVFRLRVSSSYVVFVSKVEEKRVAKSPVVGKSKCEIARVRNRQWSERVRGRREIRSAKASRGESDPRRERMAEEGRERIFSPRSEGAYSTLKDPCHSLIPNPYLHAHSMESPPSHSSDTTLHI